MDFYKKINDLYHSERGSELARQELKPIVERYLPRGGKILEVGCGYGRNLVALAEIANSQIFGTDIDQVELDKAKTRINAYRHDNIKLSLQNPESLPFSDNSFDFIVSWQVFEHVLTKKDKINLINEICRVIKNKGQVLIETPNRLFPVDYHDSNLPFVHWLPIKFRSWLVGKLFKRFYPPSVYSGILGLEKMFKQAPNVKSIKKLTAINFETSYLMIFNNLSGTRLGLKKLFFIFYLPVYCLLKLLYLPGDLFAPSVRMVLQINK